MINRKADLLQISKCHWSFVEPLYKTKPYLKGDGFFLNGSVGKSDIFHGFDPCSVS